MAENPKPPAGNIFSDRYRHEFVEVACPICNQRKIISVPDESIPKCEFCKVEMILKEVLTEGKY